MIGCHTTKDRLFASNLVASAECRFCNQVKESAHHLVHECTMLPDHLRRPCNPPQLGPNFAVLGIAEVLPEQIKHRLRCSQTSCIPVAPGTYEKCDRIHFWTDGSAFHKEHFWHTTAGFAVVDANQHVCASGPVHHWSLSSYTAELWAVIVAFAIAHKPCTIHTDNKTVCDQMNYLIQNKTISQQWSHYTWWLFAKDLFLQRLQFDQCPLLVQWIPSHVCETLHISVITEELARSHNTTCLDIACNRAADKHAKQVISQQSRTRVDSLIQHVLTWLFWLSKLNASLYVPVDVSVEPVRQTFALLDPRSPIEQFTNAFPRWNWSYDGFNFDWVTCYEPTDNCRLPASLSRDAWKVAIQYFQNLGLSSG